jgi:multidrug transporter EmrE-like cation transporter
MFSAATIWSLCAAFCAVLCEYCYRTFGDPLRYWWAFLPVQCFIGYSIYKTVTTPNTPLVGALVIWSFATIFMRVFVSFVLLQDPVTRGTWCALVLLFAARIVQTYWK